MLEHRGVPSRYQKQLLWKQKTSNPPPDFLHDFPKRLYPGWPTRSSLHRENQGLCTGNEKKIDPVMTKWNSMYEASLQRATNIHNKAPRNNSSTSNEIYKLKIKDYFCLPKPRYLTAQPFSKPGHGKWYRALQNKGCSFASLQHSMKNLSFCLSGIAVTCLLLDGQSRAWREELDRDPELPALLVNTPYLPPASKSP